MRVAVIGAGLVAKTFHVPAFLACPGVEISAVYDRRLEKAEALGLRSAMLEAVDAIIEKTNQISG